MMRASSVPNETPGRYKGADTAEHTEREVATEVEVGLLTGCRDKHYVYGLATALIARGVFLDIIGSDEVDSREYHGTPKLNFLNLGGKKRQNGSLMRKVLRSILYYLRLVHYISVTDRKLLHILWNYKVEYFDRTLLLLYYKLLGKQIVFTAHNVNAGKRDSNDSLLNRLTLRIQYRFVDHIFVHTEQMKYDLLQDFGIRDETVTVIPYGINNATPCSDLTAADAKRRLGIKEGEKAILFFGNIGPYKGLEYLVAAFQKIITQNRNYRLIVAGNPRSGCEAYVSQIRETARADIDLGRASLRIEHIPDHEIELYFKAADVLVLPYTYIFQSGILFLGYSFGLPVIATDVGSLREDIIEGETGFLCRPCDSGDLARTIERYFESDLFKNLSERRPKIQAYANGRHSWENVGESTKKVYAKLLHRGR